MVPLGLPTARSAIDAAIQKKTFGLETALVFSNEEIDDIMEIAKAFEDSILGLLIISVYW